MKGFTVHTYINRPPQEVWGVMTDLSRASAWMKDVQAIHPLDNQPLGLGSRFRTVTTGAGIEEEGETKITGWECGRRLALSSKTSGVSAIYTYTLEDLGDVTGIKLQAVCHTTRLWKLIQPLIIYLMRYHDGNQLYLLKELIETPRPRAERMTQLSHS